MFLCKVYEGNLKVLCMIFNKILREILSSRELKDFLFL